MADQSDHAAWMQSVNDRLTVLETQAPLESSSIGSGGVRVYDGGSITFDGGNTASDIRIGVEGNKNVIRMGNTIIYAGADYVRIAQFDGAGNEITSLSLQDQYAAIANRGTQLTVGPDGASIIYGNSGLEMRPTYARYRFGNKGLSITADGYSLVNVPEGAPVKALGLTSDGTVVKFTPSTGGGTGPHPTGTWVWPFPLSATTSEFAPRWGRFHEGIDLGNAPALNGAQIRSAGPGTVQTAGYHSDDGFGYWVVVNHGDWAVNGTTYTVRTVYGHMLQSPSVSAGQQVTSSTVLGLVGNTGGSFGAHLHFETHLCAAGGGSIIWKNDDPAWDNGRTANNPRTVMAGLNATGG